MTRKDDLQELISNLERRLQHRKQQAAKYGLNTPPEVAIEIEDLEVEIEQHQAELARLKRAEAEKSSATPSEPSRVAERLRQIEEKSSAQPPRINCGNNIQLSVEVKSVLRAMFSQFDRLQVEVEFGRGLTNTWVFKVRPLERGGKDREPVVVKVGPVSLIRREWDAYQQVDETISTVARIEYPPTILAEIDWAGLRYTLVGGDVHRIESLREYCLSPEVENPQRVLERLFARLGQRWWLNHHRAPIQFQAEYDQLLPVNLVVKALAAAPDGEFIELAPDNLPPGSLAAGNFVYLHGLVVTEIESDASNRQITLNLPDSIEDPPEAAYRLRLVEIPDPGCYQEGETIAPLYGQVVTTRHDVLCRLAEQAVGDGVDLSANRLKLNLEATAGLLAELPNPLQVYQKILRDFPRIKRSTIHGDLNLENVLVDPNIGEAYLIDFAATRQGHTLHDLLHLEQGVVTQLIPPALVEAGLPSETIWSIYRQLHQVIVYPVQARPNLPHSALEKPFALLATIRQTARGYLATPDDWTEYYRGLIIYLLAALKFKDLDKLPTSPRPKRVAFWGAAATQALIDEPPGPSEAIPLTPMQRVRIKLEDDCSLFSKEQETRTINELAKILEIVPDTIARNEAYAGNNVLELDFLTDAARMLRTLIAANNAKLRSLKIKEVVFEHKSDEDETWMLEFGKFQLSGINRSNEERSNSMEKDNKQGSGVFISGVQGNISGTFVGGNQTTINIGQISSASKNKPVYSEFQQLIQLIRRDLAGIINNGTVLRQISSGTLSRLQGMVDDFEEIAEQVAANSGFEVLKVKEVTDTLADMTAEFTRLMKKTKNIAAQNESQRKVVEPLIKQLELLMQETQQAELMLKRVGD